MFSSSRLFISVLLLFSCHLKLKNMDCMVLTSLCIIYPKITTGVHEEQASEERSDSKVVCCLLLELIHERMPFSPSFSAGRSYTF